MNRPATKPPLCSCPQDADHYRYDVFNEYDDDEHSFEGSGDGDDY